MAKPADNRLKLGLIIDPEFYMLEKSVCALTPPLIKAFTRRFNTRILYSQGMYDEHATDMDFLVSFEAKWAAPVIDWRKKTLRPSRRPSCPTFLMLSDPHGDPWREDYFIANQIDYLLALYDQPSRRHLTRLRPEQFVHFPWPVPESWIGTDPVKFNGHREIAVFGATTGPAYTVRNWCREQPGVKSFVNSGVENKAMTDEGFFAWLREFDAVIAAGSEDPTYRLTTPKYFETAAAGSLLFAQDTDDLESLGFSHGINCIVFTQSTFAEQVRPYLDEPENPRWLSIREAGRRLIRERHTTETRLAGLESFVRDLLSRAASLPPREPE